MSRRLTRRELAVMAAAGLVTPTGAPAAAGVTGRVGLARIASGEGGAIARAAAADAIAGAVTAGVGSGSPSAAVRRLFRPDDVVGIKLNCLAAPALSPRVELVEALIDLITAAGVDRGRIVVFERSTRELERAGFSSSAARGRYRVEGTDGAWDDRPTVSGEIGSCFARQVSSDCSALVSFGVVKDHDLAGVSAGLKNWYGVIHNPNKYHDGGCDPYLADVVSAPVLRGKLRLTVLDGVVAQCHGGPASVAAHRFELGTVAASPDPVAADAWAWRAIDGERRRRGLPDLEQAGRRPRFLDTCERRGLGVASGLEIVGGGS